MERLQRLAGGGPSGLVFVLTVDSPFDPRSQARRGVEDAKRILPAHSWPESFSYDSLPAFRPAIP